MAKDKNFSLGAAMLGGAPSVTKVAPKAPPRKKKAIDHIMIDVLDNGYTVQCTCPSNGKEPYQSPSKHAFASADQVVAFIKKHLG